MKWQIVLASAYARHRVQNCIRLFVIFVFCVARVLQQNRFTIDHVGDAMHMAQHHLTWADLAWPIKATKPKHIHIKRCSSEAWLKITCNRSDDHKVSSGSGPQWSRVMRMHSDEFHPGSYRHCLIPIEGMATNTGKRHRCLPFRRCLGHYCATCGTDD